MFPLVPSLLSLLALLFLRLLWVLPGRVWGAPPPGGHPFGGARQRTSASNGGKKTSAPSSTRRTASPPPSSSASSSSSSASSSPNTASPSSLPRPIRATVVLGSGGHTAEMMSILRAVDLRRYRVDFVLAATDTTSEPRLRADPGTFGGEAWPVDQGRLHRIPRSREVGQSWLSTLWTTAFSILACARLVWSLRADVVVCNGPGTCVPVCAVAFVLKFLGLRPQTKVIFVESFCRVKTLSFTGKLLYPLADRFVVQWPRLVQVYPRTEYIGKIY